jgi:hypothetical protein
VSPLACKSHNAAAIEGLLVELFLRAHEVQPVLDREAPMTLGRAIRKARSELTSWCEDLATAPWRGNAPPARF